jgi:hypothetical protein
MRIVDAQVECTVDLRVTGGANTMSANPTRTVCQLHGLYDDYTQIPVNNLGSRTDKQVADPTGFFHVRKIDGRWWIIDPDGYYFIHKGITSIRPGATPLQRENFSKKWGSNTTAWVDDVKTLLKQYGFTGIGGFSDEANFQPTSTDPMPYTLICNFMSQYRSKRAREHPGWGQYSISGAAVYVFDREWEEFCDEYAQTFVRYATDRNLLGFFSDNEQYFQTNTTDMLKEYLQFPDGDPCKDSTVYWLRRRLNLGDDAPVPSYANISTEVLNEFLYYAARRYYKYVSEALKKYCPNHMYIGSRNFTRERTNEWFMRSQKGYVDVISVNYYNVWTPETGQLYNWELWTDAPLIVSEFYTKAMDTGLPNTDGAGWKVNTQVDRGMFYQNYALALLQSKSCVGWHWFRYQDNDITPGANDNGDANKGIVNNNFDPYVELMYYMKDLNDKVYNIIDYFDNDVPLPDDNEIIYPEADANFQANTNKGVDAELLVKNYPTTMREIFIRFDVSNTQTEVASAKIILTKTRTKIDERPYEAMVINDNTWSETGIIQSNAPTEGSVIRIWREPTGYDTLTLHVTDYVKSAMESGDQKLSIRIRSLEGEGTQELVLRFASREHDDISARPRLVLNDKEMPDDGMLKAITIDGTYLETFSKNTAHYVFKTSDADKLPEVGAIPQNEKSLIEISQPVNINSAEETDRTATVQITSSTDAGKNYTYTVLFDVEMLPAPGNLKYDNITMSSFVASWDVEETAFKYKFYLFDSQDNPIASYTGVELIDNYITLTGLSEDQQYKFQVQGIRNNRFSLLSEPVTVQTVSIKTKASSPVDITDHSFTARWENADGATGYYFYAYNSRNEALSSYNNLFVTDTFIVVSGLNGGEEYSYNVKTIMESEISGFSNTENVVTLINSPVAIQALPVSTTSFTANWNPVSGVDTYKLLVTDAAGTALENYNMVNSTATLYEVTGLMPNTTYRYTVIAVKDDYESQASNEITVTTLMSTNTEYWEFFESKIYPNPGNGIFFIDGIFSETMILKIVNSAGNLLLETNISQLPFELNIQEQPSGNYFVIIEKGDLRKTFKVIKE